MLHTIECPKCHKMGLKIETNNGYRPIASGRKLSEFPMKTNCTVCFRDIKYDVVKDFDKEKK